MAPFHCGLLFFAALLASAAINSAQASAGFLDLESLPDTSFSCEGKVIGGYYADIETGCQMFHVCTLGGKGEVRDIKFLCLNGTIFDQETRVCERLDEVDCSQSAKFYDLNLDLYGSHAQILGRNAPPGGGSIVEDETQLASENVDYDYEEYEDEATDDTVAHESSSTSTSTTTSTTTTTAAPTTVTTTTKKEELLIFKLDSDNNNNNNPKWVAAVNSPSAPVLQLNTTALHSGPLQQTKTVIVHKEVTMSTSVEHHRVTNSHTTRVESPPTPSTTTTSTTPSPDDEELRGILEELAVDVQRIPFIRPNAPRVTVTNDKPFVPRLKRSEAPRKRVVVRRRRPAAARNTTTEAPVPATSTTTTTMATPESTKAPVVLPQTSFSCLGRIIGGLYADVEADCQMFHICAQGKKNRIIDHKFLCGSGTLFDQRTRTCQDSAKVQCHLSERFFHLNDHSQPQETDYEDDFEFARVHA